MGELAQQKPKEDAQSEDRERLHDELLDISLAKVVRRASGGGHLAEDELATHIVEHDRSVAKDKSDNPVMLQVGIPMRSGIREFHRLEASPKAKVTDLGGETTITAGLVRNEVEGYAVEDAQFLSLVTVTASGDRVSYSVDMTHALDGRYYQGTPLESKFINGKSVYTGREISSGRLAALKRLVADQYKLVYKAPKPRTFRSKEGSRAQFSEETVEYVTNLIYELRQEGLAGPDLKRKLARLLHPDASNTESDEAFKYYQSLNLDSV